MGHISYAMGCIIVKQKTIGVLVKGRAINLYTIINVGNNVLKPDNTLHLWAAIVLTNYAAMDCSHCNTLKKD